MMNEAAFEVTVEKLLTQHAEELSPLGASILAALALHLCNNSRAFARQFGVAHALVLRECVALADDKALICILAKDDKTQRLTYALSDKGEIAATGIAS